MLARDLAQGNRNQDDEKEEIGKFCFHTFSLNWRT